MNTLRHEGLIAVITGGAAGIGEAMARRLAAEGAHVAVLDKNALEAGDGSIMSVVCDVSDPTSVRRAQEQVVERFGDAQAVVHCAAYQLRRPFADLAPRDWSETMDVNAGGAFNLLQTFLPAMVEKRWGRVVLVTSSSYFSPPTGLAHYIASKGALQGLVRGLAAELGENDITINALAPGLTQTKNATATLPDELFAAVVAGQALKRRGEPDDQAGALSFLLSDDASFMTGQTLLVDGGEGRI